MTPFTLVPKKINTSLLVPSETDSQSPERKRAPTAKSLPGVVGAGQLINPNNLLNDSLAYVVKRTQVRCDEALGRYLDRGISPARFAALSMVGANPGISQTALGGLLNIAGASVVKVVDELERVGLIRRESSSDRRVYALQLTEKGIADLKRYEASIQKFEIQIASQLTREERAQLIMLLSKVAPDEA